MLNADILKELAKDCNAERVAEKKNSACCAGCPLGSICPVFVRSLREKGDGRTFKVEETNFIKPCSDCFSRRAPADKCYEGDPYFRCPEYLKHVEKVGD